MVKEKNYQIKDLKLLENLTVEDSIPMAHIN
jgi:hypothetical protein